MGTNVLTIETPRVYAPLLHPHRYKGAKGGRGSGKSHHFAEDLVERCVMVPGTRWVCIREIQKSLEQSVKFLVASKIEKLGVGAQFRVLNTHIETPGGGIITFMGMQNHTAESIKSLEAYDGAWVEEAQTLSQTSLDLLRPTIRKEGSEMWFSWNPRHATDPVDVFFRDNPPDSVVVKSTWQDNPWFPDTLRPDMEWDRRRDPEKYAHVWGGQHVQRSEACVFKNWRIEEFDTPPGTVFYFGSDWGFSTDPTVCVRCWIKGRILYVDWEAHKHKCEIEDSPALFDRVGCVTCSRLPLEVSCEGRDRDHGMARKWEITADSARPETISHMRRHGYPRVMPAKKGPGSLMEGVEFLQSYDIVVHPRCVHTADELTLYKYKVDPLTDRPTPILEDKKNHVIDSLRYALEQARQGGGRVRSTSESHLRS